MKIAVASGKGGTGKTAISTSLSAVVKQKVHLLDCDVENPNAYLYMKPEDVVNERATVLIPEIDHDACIRCDKCIDACQFGALVDAGENIMFLSTLCHSCAACWTVCPEEGVITPVTREFGDINHGVSQRDRPIKFTEGMLDITEMITPTMIGKVKGFIDPENISIIDSPPGAGCPLYETVDDTDYVVLVTEPTVFGLHDLRRAHKLIQEMGIPVGVVINRSTIGKAPVREFCDENNIPILLEIPFERIIAEKYSSGELLIDIIPELHDKFTEVLNTILETVQEATA